MKIRTFCRTCIGLFRTRAGLESQLREAKASHRKTAKLRAKAEKETDKEKTRANSEERRYKVGQEEIAALALQNKTLEAELTVARVETKELAALIAKLHAITESETKIAVMARGNQRPVSEVM